MTTIISSQRYIDSEIVNEKKSILEKSSPSEIVLPVWDVKEYDCAILYNGHHTFEAAKELNIPVRFEITEHPEQLSGDELLDQCWIDSDWYDVETGILAF